MGNLFGSSGDGEIVQPLPKGIRVNGSNTHPKILTQLPSNGIQWYKIAPRDYPSGQIRSNSYTKIYDKKYRPLKIANKSDGDYIHVFEKQRPAKNNGFGGGGGGNGKSANGLDLCAMCGTSNSSQLNTDPAVFITIPKKDSIVERGADGVEANGAAYDSTSVALSWPSGSESKEVSNDSWKTTLPLGVGEHELTVSVDGDTKSVKFTVVLKPAITGYTAEQIQELQTYTNNAKISEVEQNADTLAREAGLKETADDYAGFAICRKVNDFASNATGDFCLFYSGSGDKAFIEKKIDRIFGAHLSESKKSALIAELDPIKKAGFVNATDAFHDAMKNTLDIFFAENSIGKTIAEMDIPLGVNPGMMLVMDAAKTVVNIKLNIQLGSESNGAPLLMRQQARKNVFDAIAVEVVGAAVGGVVIKAGSKAFKVIKSFFTKFEYKFSKTKTPKNFDKIYKKSSAAKAEIDQVANDIAKEHGGKVAQAPIKSKERAIQKINADYGGDATRIKDLARNTIVVSEDKIAITASQLKSRGANIKVIDGNTDPLGYSGINSTIKTKNGMTAEIQVNSPAMIYAKESEKNAKIILGDDLYNTTAKKAGVPGGKGHKLYEDWRSLEDSNPAKQTIEKQSKEYYDLIRGNVNAN